MSYILQGIFHRVGKGEDVRLVKILGRKQKLLIIRKRILFTLYMQIWLDGMCARDDLLLYYKRRELRYVYK